MDGLDSGKGFIDKHGVEQGLVESGLEFVGDEEDLIIVTLELFGNFRGLNAAIHTGFGEFSFGKVIEGDGTGEDDEGFNIGVAFVLNVAIESQIILDGVFARSSDYQLRLFSLWLGWLW